MFKTSNMETCQEQFRFRDPSDLVASRSKKLESDANSYACNFRIDFAAYLSSLS